MQYTFSKHAKDVMAHRDIKEAWVKETLDSPMLTEKIADDKIVLYTTIEAYENRCLKVVVNPQKRLIVTVYFDRGMRKRGCK